MGHRRGKDLYRRTRRAWAPVRREHWLDRAVRARARIIAQDSPVVMSLVEQVESDMREASERAIMDGDDS